MEEQQLHPFECLKTEQYEDYEAQEPNLPVSAYTPSQQQQQLNAFTAAEIERDELATLLKKWNLFEQLYGFLKFNGITVEALRYIKERHLDELFAGENLNTKIIFEHKLTLWQQKFGIYYLQPRSVAPVPATPLPDAFPYRAATCNQQTCELTADERTVHGTLTIRDILHSSADGKRILDIYNDAKVLMTPHRTAVVHKIVQYFIERSLKISVKLCKRIAEQIVIVFPTEKIDTYFAQTNSKVAPKGKIWDRYQSRKRRLKGMCLHDNLKTKKAKKDVES